MSNGYIIILDTNFKKRQTKRVCVFTINSIESMLPYLYDVLTQTKLQIFHNYVTCTVTSSRFKTTRLKGENWITAMS